MELVVSVAQAVLALVFILASVTKLCNLKRFRETVVSFGLPDWAAHPVALILPFVELAVAITLLSTTTRTWGAVGAVTLLVAFVVGISFNLARGKKPACQCFGQLHSEPIGAATLIRNGALLLLAGLVLWQGPLHPGLGVWGAVALAFGRHGTAALIDMILAAAIAVQTWLILHLFRQNGRLLLRMDALEARSKTGPHQVANPQAGLRVGSPAPDFELPLASGGMSTLDHLLRSGKPALLIFSDTNCGPCKALLPDIGRWQTEFSSKMTVALISRGAHNEKSRAKHGLLDILVQKGREVAEQYLAFGTPSAVLIAPNKTIASGLASGAEQITALVNAAASGKLPIAPSPKGSVLKVGDSVPSFTARDLDGHAVDSALLDSGGTILLFWNPSCGFCGRMLPDLKNWQQLT